MTITVTLARVPRIRPSAHIYRSSITTRKRSSRNVCIYASVGHGSLSFWSTEEQPTSSGRSGVVRFRHSVTRHLTLQEKIGAAGLSGIASYGLFNTLYYFFAYLAILYSLPKPSTITSTSTAVAHVLKLLALVWAGSQVTKVPRAACALACAPLMDRLLGVIRDGFKLGNKRQAFLYVLVPICWLLFFVLLGISILSLTL